MNIAKASSIKKGIAASAAAASLLLGTVDPSAANHLGSGVASGTEDQLDAGDPPVNGTIDVVGNPPNTGPVGACGRVKDNDYTDATIPAGDSDTLSAQYTLNSPDGTYTFGGVQYQGITIVVETSAVFYFGPQGTHYGKTALNNDCGAGNLGRLSPVPATITVTAAGGSPSCSGTGHFWREGGDEFGVSGSCAGTLTFTGIFQPPCGFLVPCINGAYTQH
jgi:hypothetical protein